ncbi:MAG: IS91 family transposase, partial [Shimia sp.]|nr:IS91 family transposase [Shimia sp.]
QWKPITNGYLLPFQVVRKLFAGKYIAALRKARQQGDLQLPGNMTARQFQALLNKLSADVKWNVHIRERYEHGEGVVAYLADYMQGGPVNNGQIEKNTEQNTTKQIILGYTDHRDHKRKKLALTPQHFIQRLLWHIPKPRQQRARYYGLYHPKKEDLRGKCREHLGQGPEQEPEFLDWQ